MIYDYFYDIIKHYHFLHYNISLYDFAYSYTFHTTLPMISKLHSVQHDHAVRLREREGLRVRRRGAGWAGPHRARPGREREERWIPGPSEAEGPGLGGSRELEVGSRGNLRGRGTTK
jgi:hypothetical protein